MSKGEKKGLAFWKKNAEEDYFKTPISVLRYITELEDAIKHNEYWISVKDRWPDYDPVNNEAFSLWIKATNNRYYAGYVVIGYGKITFYQHNGRKILNVTDWQYINPKKQNI